jgi:hypothetical protein
MFFPAFTAAASLEALKICSPAEQCHKKGFYQNKMGQCSITYNIRHIKQDIKKA